MSPESQRIAIAEACGITKGQSGAWYGYKIDGNATAIPDYLNDLNAMHEAEKHICRRGYNVCELLYPALVDVCGIILDAAFATAAQRAEAFLRTLGKWEARASSDLKTKEDE